MVCVAGGTKLSVKGFQPVLRHENIFLCYHPLRLVDAYCTCSVVSSLVPHVETKCHCPAYAVLYTP